MDTPTVDEATIETNYYDSSGELFDGIPVETENFLEDAQISFETDNSNPLTLAQGFLIFFKILKMV